MICALCKCEIDQDSFYCDMCGEEIKTCPVCKRFGKGKVCTSCGKPLILAKAQNEPIVNNISNSYISTPHPALGIAQETTNNTASAYRLPDVEQYKSAVPQLRLLNKNIKVDLRIDDNSIIGATAGQYTAIFSPFNKTAGISGRHCRFNYDVAKGWTVTDLGSTFKTKYNEQELSPNVPQLINDQSYIKIGDIEFFVRIILD